jgi:hypothetical protein
MLNAADHFGHREGGGIAVDLFWDHRDGNDKFRVEVEDRSGGVRFFLYPTTGREAIRAFHHPFATASGGFEREAVAA